MCLESGVWTHSKTNKNNVRLENYRAQWELASFDDDKLFNKHPPNKNDHLQSKEFLGHFEMLGTLY